MDGDSQTNQELLQEVQELRRQLAAAQDAARAREETLRGELSRAEAERQRLVEALKEYETDHQCVSVTFQTQAEELQAANEELATQAEELATQAEELQVQSEELQIQNEELLNQNDELHMLARLLEDQKQELERLARKLEEERTLLEAVLEQMPAGVVIAAAPAGPIFLTNQRAVEIWPYPLAPFADLETFWRIPRYHPDGRPYRVEEMPLHRSLTLGEVVEDEEFLLQPEDRGPIHFRVSSAPVRDTEGRIIAAVVTHSDITARQAAEQEIRHFANFPLLNPNPVLEVDEEGRVIFANPAALQVAEKLGLPAGVGAFLPPDLPERFAAARQGGSREYSFDLTLGDAVFAVTFHLPHDLPTARLYALDITARKRVEQALRESREDLNLAQAVAHTGSWRLDMRRNELFWSDETYRLFGISPGTPLTYEAFLAVVHPDDREYVDRQWTAALRGKPYDIEHRISVGDTVKWVRARAELEVDLQGELLAGFGTVQDITERKQAEAALRRAHAELEERVQERTADLRGTVAQLQEEVMERQQAEEGLKFERQRLFNVLERIPAHVALLRPDHTCAFVNGEFVRRFGDPGSKRCYEILGQQNPCVECQAMAVFHTGKPVAGEWAAPDGNTYQIYDYPFIDVDGSPLVLEMGVDITARQQAEQQAVRLGRMYRMVSQVNETIVRARNQETLFRQVCRIMMEAGDFLLAWVGLVDRETRLVKAATQFDLMDEYLQNITIPLDDVPEGRGPTGTAVREGRYDFCNDIAGDPRMAPWREQALARGFRSSAAFPLRVGAEIVGALTLYAGRPGFFTDDEIALLESLVGDLAFALDFMDQETKRRRAEAALRESEERLRHLASQLLHAQERERHRLALELHDDLGQSLMVLKLQIRGIEKMLTPGQWQIKQQCDQTLGYLTAVVDNVRRLSRDLRPSILEDLGLSAALRVLADEFRKYHEVELSLDMDDLSDLFSPEEEINMFRIFQECLTNIAKHARASRVAIAIKRQEGRVAFRVEDNGRGFDLEGARTADPASRGLGLSALEERVHMLGGALEIRSQEDRGTTLAFTVPLTTPWRADRTPGAPAPE
ncbi:MAG: GAF domain-containing protein [Desulfobaccales bacterium]